MCPSPLNATSFEVHGKHIITALELSLDAQHCLSDGRGPGFRGKYTGSLHIAGAKIIHDGKRVIDILIGEKSIQKEKWYTVATSDYLHRGSGYESLANNRNQTFLAEEIKDVIRIYASKKEFVERASVSRWIDQENHRLML
ncbi:5'-nucleotidase C-terminal domain-containing protein [Fictibacillus sp. WQ 8-8]|nr:5'-nucleotidase C-terminal domain-containing protein [Fictibacillus sp. WQ 8-8]